MSDHDNDPDTRPADLDAIERRIQELQALRLRLLRGGLPSAEGSELARRMARTANALRGECHGLAKRLDPGFYRDFDGPDDFDLFTNNDGPPGGTNPE